VIIDALDEVVSPSEARIIVKQIVRPLVETCSSVGAQVVVGTRRHDDDGDLLDCFSGAISKIDLDESEFFAVEDLAAYSLATLQLLGDERPDNPYNDGAIAARVATRIAQLSDRNFLVAGLVARTHGMHDEVSVKPEELSFTATVEDALQAFLDRSHPLAGISAKSVLTALAFAQSTGLAVDLWQIAINALVNTSIDVEELTQFTRSSAGNFLIESGSDGRRSAYRLFHQALSDTLLDARRNIRTSEADEASITRAFITHGRNLGWASAPTYLLQSLPVHAAHADLIDELLLDDDYLLYVDLRRIIPLVDAAQTTEGRSRARLLQLTPQAIGAGPDIRTAVFSVTEKLEDLGNWYSQARTPAPYQAIWASSSPRGERALFEGHTASVNGLFALDTVGFPFLASAGDSTVRIWNLDTGQMHRILTCDGSIVKSICAFTDNGHVKLAAGCTDGIIYIWDLETEELQSELESHSGAVNAICCLHAEGQALLASAGGDSTIRIWAQRSNSERILRGHSFAVNDVCAFTQGGRVFLASAGGDDTIRIWDIETGESIDTLRGHIGPVNGICAFTEEDRILLASAGGDDTIRRVAGPGSIGIGAMGEMQ